MFKSANTFFDEDTFYSKYTFEAVSKVDPRLSESHRLSRRFDIHDFESEVNDIEDNIRGAFYPEVPSNGETWLTIKTDNADENVDFGVLVGAADYADSEKALAYSKVDEICEKSRAMFDTNHHNAQKFQVDIGTGPKVETISVMPVIHGSNLKMRDVCISGKDSRLPSSEVYCTNKELIKKCHNLRSKVGARTNDIKHFDEHNLELSLQDGYNSLLSITDLVHSAFSFWALRTGEWKNIKNEFEYKWNLTHNYCDSIWITSLDLDSNRLYYSIEYDQFYYASAPPLCYKNIEV